MNIPQSDMPHNRQLLSIILIALFLRALYPIAIWLVRFDLTAFWQPDTLSYLLPAQNLLKYMTGVSDNVHVFVGIFNPELVRTPGYPLFLIPGVAAGRVELVTVILQVLLSTATVYLVYRIALLIFESGKIAIVSAVLYSIEPLSINYTAYLLTETFFTFTLCLSVSWLIRWMKDEHISSLIFGTIAMAITVYIRPISLYLPVLLTFFFFAWSLCSQKKRLLLQVSIFLVASISFIAPWNLRNYLTTGYNSFSAITSINLYFYHAAALNAAKSDIPFDEYKKDIEAEFNQKHHGWQDVNQAESFNIMTEQGKDTILTNPWLFIKLNFWGMVKTALGPGIAVWWKTLWPDAPVGLGAIINPFVTRPNESPRNAVQYAYVLTEGLALFQLLFYYSMALYTIFIMRAEHFWPVMLLLTVMLYLIMVPSILGVSRMRHPVMPMLAILAGAGFEHTKIALRNFWEIRRTSNVTP